MQAKKIIAIALCAAMFSSVTALTVNARPEIPSQEMPYDKTAHTFGAVGSFNNWARPDIPLSDEDGDGIYTGKIEGLNVGKYEGKVRDEGGAEYDYTEDPAKLVQEQQDWLNSWGVYDEDKETSYDGGNVAFEITEAGQVVNVKFDTTAGDYNEWKVSFEVQGSAAKAITFESLGLVGTLTNWGGKDDAGNVTPDIAMKDDDGDGIYEATVTLKSDDEFNSLNHYDWLVQADDSTAPSSAAFFWKLKEMIAHTKPATAKIP